MCPPKYDGTMHPEEWIQQVETFCLCNNIEISTAILYKKLIHPAIKIPSIVNIITKDEILNALKVHASFTIFKESCKRKLLALKHIPEKDGGDTMAFLSKFQSLCYNTEINDIEEIKNIIHKIMISNEFFKSEFSKRSKKISSMEELLALFGDIIEDEANLIKSGSCIALKHAATGKYLSSVSNLNYKTGSYSQAVFAGETFPGPNTLWIITFSSQSSKKYPYTNFAFYDDKIYLNHKMTSRTLICSGHYISPLYSHTEVGCNIGRHIGYSTAWKLKRHASSTNNNCTCVKSQDRIILQNDDFNKVLRSHELEFDLNNEKFQEVFGHDKRVGGNDEWIIELIS
ncbi:unnamed protein product [Rhizophagus irregularis]|uniref:MIR domain-containing protein n=1 Tax=Rhizophagus irregularis TaxID=588596 RepID=A0A2N1NBJ4_9GLOM|nr:hypothetical protein RhiirC2_778734 [Rhizophagus irregularis]CAB4389075.1 unnamed protein product [Rhizophagus irregularis]CAB5384599.1 unnamed protein product [Rhizophagus irregularis]